MTVPCKYPASLPTHSIRRQYFLPGADHGADNVVHNCKSRHTGTLCELENLMGHPSFEVRLRITPCGKYMNL